MGAVIAEFCSVDITEEMLASSEEDGCDCQVHFIDEPFAKILANSGHATAEANVFSMAASVARACAE